MNDEDYIIECPEKPYFGFFPNKEVLQILIRKAINTKSMTEIEVVLLELEKSWQDLEKELWKKIKAEEKS